MGYPEELLQCYTAGTTVLNAPLGSSRYMEDHFTQAGERLKPLCEDVASLQDSHVAFHLLKACLGVCKINYLLRVTPPACTGPGALIFDRMMQSAQRTIVGGTLDSAIFRELQLPVAIKTDTQIRISVSVSHLLSPQQQLRTSHPHHPQASCFPTLSQPWHQRPS